MSIAKAARELFRAVNPPFTDLRAFAQSLATELESYGFEKCRLYSENAYYSQEHDGRIKLTIVGKNSSYGNHHDDRHNCHEVLDVTFVKTAGLTKIEVKPRQKQFFVFFDSKMGGASETFFWLNKVAAERKIGQWILDCGTPKTANKLRVHLNQPLPAADLKAALK